MFITQDSLVHVYYKRIVVHCNSVRNFNTLYYFQVGGKPPNSDDDVDDNDEKIV